MRVPGSTGLMDDASNSCAKASRANAQASITVNRITKPPVVAASGLTTL
jgi:hypothetical protein